MFPVNRFVFSKIKNDSSSVSASVSSSVSATSVVQPSVRAAAQPMANVDAITMIQPAAIAAATPFSKKRVLVSASVATKLFTPIFPEIIINPPIPLASTQNGNLFNDKFDKNLLWYLPAFSLLGDTDASFNFVATPALLPGSDAKPFYIASVSFTIGKEIPADAVNAKAGDSSINLREIPLDGVQLALFIAYNDEQGNETHTSYIGTLQANDNGNFEVHVDNIKGAHVAILYQNLKVTGRVQVALSATYLAWREEGAPVLLFLPRLWFLTATKFSLISSKTSPSEPPPVVQSPESGKDGFNETETFSQLLDLNKKYSGNEYQLSYKLHLDTGERVIIGANDLTNLSGNPTEFTELKTIDVSRYPSIRALYIGSISKVVIMIPRAYGIVRKARTCSAICFALVDSTPSNPDSCKFQFQFEITPDVDPIDIIMLHKEMQNNNDLQSYSLKFADNLSSKFPSTLNSAFSADTNFVSSVTPENFLITTVISDKPGQSAVASANLFIQQLCHAPEACVIGTINLELDNNFPDSVFTPVTLSLPGAISDDGISWSIVSDLQAIDTQTIKLTNSTSFNFLIERYTFSSDQGISDPITANIPIATDESVHVPLPQNFNDLSIVLDYVEQSNGLVNRTNISEYMEMRTQDVQNVQYFLGVSSSQVKYEDHGIKQIDVQVTLNTVSTVNVPQFSVMKLNTSGGTKILLPLQFAITSLPATINLTVSFLDTNKQAVSFTKENDFIGNPIFDITDSDVSGAVNA